tara:strand:+ start:190 stop:387 length:198 start_codon:yes stop_codon:yes gene_type:complete
VVERIECGVREASEERGGEQNNEARVVREQARGKKTGIWGKWRNEYEIIRISLGTLGNEETIIYW